MEVHMSRKKYRKKPQTVKQDHTPRKKKPVAFFIIYFCVVLLIVGGAAFYKMKNSQIFYKTDEITSPLKLFDDGKARHFQFKTEDGILIKYFVVKSSDGVIRAAFDACDVCWRSGKGYYQEGDNMVCGNCGRRFASVKVNEVKGGCNPAPLVRKVEGENLVIWSDLDHRGFSVPLAEVPVVLDGDTRPIWLLESEAEAGTVHLSTSGRAMNFTIPPFYYTTPLQSIMRMLAGEQRRAPLFVGREQVEPIARSGP